MSIYHTNKLNKSGTQRAVIQGNLNFKQNAAGGQARFKYDVIGVYDVIGCSCHRLSPKCYVILGFCQRTVCFLVLIICI